MVGGFVDVDVAGEDFYELSVFFPGAAMPFSLRPLKQDYGGDCSEAAGE